MLKIKVSLRRELAVRLVNDQRLAFSATMLSSLLAVAKLASLWFVSISLESYSRSNTKIYLHKITDFKV